MFGDLTACYYEYSGPSAPVTVCVSGQKAGVRGVMQSVKERCRLLAVDHGADTVLECGYAEFVTKMAAKVQQPGIPTGAGKRKTAEAAGEGAATDEEALTAGASAVAAGLTAAVTGAAAAMAKGGVKLPTAKKAKLAKAASAVAQVGAALSAVDASGVERAAPDDDDSDDSDDDEPLSAMLPVPPTPPAKKKPGPKSKAGPLTASLACSTRAAPYTGSLVC